MIQVDSSSPSQGPAAPGFLSGCRDSLPVCFAFLFLFFSIGASCRRHEFTAAQALATTLGIHAAPLQAFLAQNASSLSLATLLFAALVINFRFIFISSALASSFQRVPLWQSLVSVQMLSASTFTLCATRKGAADAGYPYFLGCGSTTLASALLSTGLGFHFALDHLPFAGGIVDIVLPVHFSALAALSWPRAAPLLATAAGFLLTPVLGRYLQPYHVFALAIGVGLAALLFEACAARRAA